MRGNKTVLRRAYAIDAYALACLVFGVIAGIAGGALGALLGLALVGSGLLVSLAYRAVRVLSDNLEGSEESAGSGHANTRGEDVRAGAGD